MIRIILISVGILLSGLYGCRPTKPKVNVDDRKDVKITTDSSSVLQDTLVEVISPPVATDRKVDTLLFQAADLFTTVVGQRNPLGMRQGNMEVKIPVYLKNGGPDTKDSLIAFAYWIGIGEPGISAYAALAEEIPPPWGQPGITPPLAAYALGHPVDLPGLTTGGSSSVRYDFVDSPGSIAFSKEENYPPLLVREAALPNFGIINGAELQRLSDTLIPNPRASDNTLRFFFAYANQHAVNTYRIQLKVVGIYGVFER